MKHELHDSQVHWWTERWWAKEEYTRLFEGKIALEEVDAKIERVKDIFNEAWGKETGLHRVHWWLLMKGTMALGFLLGLGSDLESLDGCDGLREVIRGLRNSNEFESARFELALGAILAERGHRIVFH